MKKQVAISKYKKNKLIGLGVLASAENVYLYFHTSTDDNTTFHLARSTDGLSFEKIPKDLVIEKGIIDRENISKCKNFNISLYSNHFLMLYARKERDSYKIGKAWSKNLYTWSYEGDMIDVHTKGFLLGDNSFQKQQILYAGTSAISIFLSRDLIHWEKHGKEILEPRSDHFDSGSLETEYAFTTERGIILFYHSVVNGKYVTGVALFDKNDPQKLLWRCQDPVWSQPHEWDKKNISPIGTVVFNGNIISYWQIEGEGIYALSYAVVKTSDGHKSKDISLKLNRSAKNPLITPNHKNSWEAFTTFNPAAIYDSGKVHILYRAQGFNYVSVVGYATSKDGIHIDERLDEPIYLPSEQFEYTGETKPRHISTFFMSGGGYGGCEDPRITRIDDRFYLTYVAFDGYNPPRVALTSIAADDFLKRRWFWEKPVLISPPGVVDKSAVIFPEKIHGKYVIMHRIYPDILIDFVDDLNFDGTSWLEGQYKISPRPTHWDSRKIGAGAPPLKTKYGWLLIYQSVGEQDSGRYKVGAMLLDMKDPTKVLHRSQSPILEPDAYYENNGFKSGVIYPCGAVVIDDTLYVYYGGADSYVCVATANLEEFLRELRHSEIAKLKNPVIEKVF